MSVQCTCVQACLGIFFLTGSHFSKLGVRWLRPHSHRYRGSNSVKMLVYATTSERSGIYLSLKVCKCLDVWSSVYSCRQVMGVVYSCLHKSITSGCKTNASLCCTYVNEPQDWHGAGSWSNISKCPNVQLYLKNLFRDTGVYFQWEQILKTKKLVLNYC